MPDDPDRDRRLAATPRRWPRRSRDVSQLAQEWLSSSEAKALRRQAGIGGALRQVLPELLLERTRIGSVRRGVLTLHCADTVAQAELKQHWDAAVRAALVAAGTGVTRITYRLQRTPRSPPSR